MKKRILSMLLAVAMLMSMAAMLSGCNKGGSTGSKSDAFVIMTDALDGLFNPFYSTSQGDGTIVGMTQISLIGARYDNAQKSIAVAYGENEPVVALNYEIVNNGDDTYSYYFVLKNGIKFSDGHPLTMEDVLFNFYTYLDPVYTGSNTMYSTKIQGLAAYRTQRLDADENTDALINDAAANRAQDRLNELINVFKVEMNNPSNYSEVDYETMKNAIAAWTLGEGYKAAVSADPSKVSNTNLQEDYDLALELFKEELGRDYASAQESYTDSPYKEHDEFKDEVFCFMYTEGYVEVEYELDEEGKKDRSKIKELTKLYSADIDTKEEAINYVYNDKIARELDIILSYWATAVELATRYTAKAKEIILTENKGDGEGLAVPGISGIVSLGHSAQKGETITVNGEEYKIASAHNADGTVANEGEYDVLKITIDGVDPKAIWNFSVTVAPQHYYGEGAKTPMDIENNQYGVDYGSFDFMSKVIQSVRNVKLPMGAGVYKVTDDKNSDNPGESDFYKNNVCYFKANTNFETVGSGLNNAYIEKVRYQVVTSNNAIPALKDGTVHYITPSMTNENYDELTKMQSQGYLRMATDQLGYGYIGINASKVQDLYLRRAIMSAMNTALALDYYRSGTASQIYWPMSKVSWAYPDGEDATYNGKDYPMAGGWDLETAKQNIQKYMDMATVSESKKELSVTFTIAGSTLQDHPTYKVFRDAAALLNEMGWDVDVVCDTQALTKISTGSLEVWAAAWSSSLDPDMYQVYHKNSTATSVKAWGYPHLLDNGSDEEKAIINKLSDLIDQGRETNDQEAREDIYQEAMGYVLDLAVELPVYQRSVLYAINCNVIDKDSLPAENELNPYSSPLDRIWELKFAE